jgi:hypothetical protein
VSAHRVFVCAILLYLTLDLSFAMLPGAFEFASEESVESARQRRPMSMSGPSTATGDARARSPRLRRTALALSGLGTRPWTALDGAFEYVRKPFTSKRWSGACGRPSPSPTESAVGARTASLPER